LDEEVAEEKESPMKIVEEQPVVVPVVVQEPLVGEVENKELHFTVE